MIPAAKFVNESVIDPILESSECTKELRRMLNKGQEILSVCNYTGDVYRYIKSVANDEKASKRFDVIKESEDLKTFNSIFASFEKEFSEELEQVSTMDDLVINQVYTGYEVSVYSYNYSNARGIEFANSGIEERTKTSLMLKGYIKAAQEYTNNWIEKDKRLMYFLMRYKEEGTPSLTSESHRHILDNTLPLHFFETTKIDGVNNYKYKGLAKFDRMSEDYPELAVELVFDKQDAQEIIKTDSSPSKGSIQASYTKDREVVYDDSDPIARDDGKSSADAKKLKGEEIENCFIKILKEHGYTDIQKSNKNIYDVKANLRDKEMYFEVKSFSGTNDVYISESQVKAILNGSVCLALVNETGSEVSAFLSKEIDESSVELKEYLNKSIEYYKDMYTIKNLSNVNYNIDFDIPSAVFRFQQDIIDDSFEKPLKVKKEIE